MFIRKRTNKTKEDRVTASYQAIETYREGGKVKQRILCNLGGHSTPEAALKEAEHWLHTYEERVSNPRPFGWSGRYHSLRYQAKLRRENEDDLLKWRKQVESLRTVVSRLSRQNDSSDTTGSDY